MDHSAYNASWQLPKVQMLHSTRGDKRLLWVIENICQCILANNISKHNYANGNMEKTMQIIMTINKLSQAP
jgi:hypothetical protein